ncbi:hypothetical protein C9J01_10020 [Photobacterium rosenbergii]|uniref:Carboxypeptidase regulatory-like domain-containing protein n=1 Tax=Photobacterium rosenbergii TaxID=294936 RepID=A0A2T3NF44_9GAMM|nr:hypothetical protein [Photobacterium rosenbergii]PSW13184.1 hypothetical protein C9J01_10015 [Photobacterium rosenbergii]PSW13185.1 hypothetical protein C9J01_10020 [Photobacterium rosenbergii]
MLKSIALSTLLVASMSASAVDLNITDSGSGLHIKATDQSAPAAGLKVNVTNVPQLNGSSFTTDENGRVFIPLSLNASRSVKVVATDDMDMSVASRTVFHSHSR